MTSNTKPYIIVKNIAFYIKSNIDRANVHSVIKPDGSYVYLLEGKETPGAEFEANNPLPELQKVQSNFGYHLDGRTNWID